MFYHESREASVFGLLNTKSLEGGRNIFITVHELWNLEDRNKTTELLRTENNVIPVVFHKFAPIESFLGFWIFFSCMASIAGFSISRHASLFIKI